MVNVENIIASHIFSLVSNGVCHLILNGDVLSQWHEGTNVKTKTRKWNESGFRPPFCTYRLNWARTGEPPEDGEMIEMTLSSRYKIQNSSTLPLGHGGSPQYWLSHVDGEETFFVSLKPPEPGTVPRTLAWKAAVLTNTLRPPPTKTRKEMGRELSLK